MTHMPVERGMGSDFLIFRVRSLFIKNRGPHIIHRPIMPILDIKFVNTADRVSGSICGITGIIDDDSHGPFQLLGDNAQRCLWSMRSLPRRADVYRRLVYWENFVIVGHVIHHSNARSRYRVGILLTVPVPGAFHGVT